MEEVHVREQFPKYIDFGAGHRCFTSTRRWSATDDPYTMRLALQLNCSLLSRNKAHARRHRALIQINVRRSSSRADEVIE